MPFVEPRERLRQQRVPLLFNGVSQQPPTARLISHVGDAENADFSVADGLTRRPPSWIQQHVPDGLLPAGNNWMREIVRDGTERYLVIHNRTAVSATIRVLELASNIWATVVPSTAAQVYLNAGNPDHLRFRTLIDYTIIVNQDVALAGTGSSGTIANGSGLATALPAGLANPTPITSAAHGLASGDLVFLRGTTSVPRLDGLWSVTVVDANTFTVPQGTTVGGGIFSWIGVAIDAANPAIIHSTAHGLTTGDTVVIAGTNSEPVIDGAQQVTVLDADRFTVPVAVTFPGTVGTWSIRGLDASTMPMAMVRQNTGGRTGTMTVGTSSGLPLTSICTTPTPHGLVTGQTITVTNSTTVPTMDYDFVVTVTGPTTFTIPTAIVGPSGVVNPGTATWTARAYFTIDEIDWADRPSGDETTNPLLEMWAQGRKITDVRYWRGRLALFSDTRITTSQAEDLFNFWIQDVNAVSDSDPINVSLSSDRVADIDYAQPIQEALLLLTKAGRQFIVSGGSGGLTTTTIQARPVTGYNTLPTEPNTMDPAVYYIGQSGTSAQLLEYLYDEVAAPSSAEDVTAHAPSFIPLLGVAVPPEIGAFTADTSQIKRIAVSPEHGMVFLLRKDRVVGGEVFGRHIFVYRTRYIGRQKAQSAWTRWKVSGVRGIHDISVIGNYLYFLAHHGHTNPGTGLFEPHFFVGRIALPFESAADTIPSPSL